VGQWSSLDLQRALKQRFIRQLLPPACKGFTAKSKTIFWLGCLAAWLLGCLALQPVVFEDDKGRSLIL